MGSTCTIDMDMVVDQGSSSHLMSLSLMRVRKEAFSSTISSSF